MEKGKKPEGTEKREGLQGALAYCRQRWKWLIAAALLGFTGDAPIPHGKTGEVHPAESILAPSAFPVALQGRIELQLQELGLQKMQWSGSTLRAHWLGMQLTVDFSKQGNAHTLRAGAITLTSERPLEPAELARVTEDLLLCASRMERSPAQAPHLPEGSSLQRAFDGSLQAQDTEGKRWIITPDGILPVVGEYQIDEVYGEWKNAENEEEKQAAEGKMEVRLRSPDGQEILQRHSPYDREKFTRTTRTGDTETQHQYTNGRMVSGWSRNPVEGWLEEVHCDERGSVGWVSRFQVLPSGERRFLFRENRYYRDDGSVESIQRERGDVTSYARTGEQVARRGKGDKDKMMLVRPDGTTIGTFNDEKAKRPHLTEEEYFRELANTLTTPEHLQQYFRFFQYTNDTFHPLQLLSPFASFQHPHTTARRELGGKLCGDCEDYALFFQEILHLQGHNARVIMVNVNKSSKSNHAVCVWLRPRARGKGFDVVVIDTGGVYINGRSISDSRYEPYSDSVETPEEALQIIEKQFNYILDPRAIETTEWNGLEYELGYIDVSHMLPGAPGRTRMHPIMTAFHIARLMAFASIAFLAGSAIYTIRERRRRREDSRRQKKEEEEEEKR